MKTVAVSSAATNFIANGGRDLDTSRVGELPAFAAGEHVRVTDPNGDEIGIAVVDTDNQRLRVFGVPDDGFASIDGALIGWRVERAFKWRKQLSLPGDEHAYRVVHGAGDGLPGFAADVLGKSAVVYVYGAGLMPLGRQLANAVVGFAGLEGAVIKLRARGGASEVSQETVGKAPAEQIYVVEPGADIRYEIHPHGGLNVGLFTDMREQRRGLFRFVSGKRVLNLFSYTGALSVTAAKAGAETVTSVDTSAGVQAWAQGNFARAGFAQHTRWKFETGDAVRFLTRAARDKERYDVVMIDPPTFSTARGAPWTLDRDYPALIGQAAEVIPAGGILWLAANTHELGSLAKLALKGLRAANRHAAIVEQGGLPPEYPTVAAQPHDRYLQICVLRIL